MTSTFPTTRSNSQTLKYGIRELQHKKEALISLEAALKKRINEFRELCLKEGELTGHLPADYPLQPREPIPQVRRRITRSNGNIPSEFYSSVTNSVMPPPALNTIRAQNNYNVANLHPANSSSCPHPEPALFRSYQEESKPFQMSDFYKYSSKHRQNLDLRRQPDNALIENKSKTTRQLQDEIATMKNPLKFAPCDDQIQTSRRLIEMNDQKLMKATAKAISSNPSLAERLNSIALNHSNLAGQRY